ncbi:hypothetical protein ACWCQN_44175 [Streptomyces sp. NPDC001984]|uniref:hypothetical protein n=1 Tax=Streptomyces sp. NPDC002619 TaxID=3364655 RepID=UPI00369C2D0E
MTYDLLRSWDSPPPSENPGRPNSLFPEFPDGFTYVLALQEASVIADNSRRQDAGPADRGGGPRVVWTKRLSSQVEPPNKGSERRCFPV